MRLVLPLVGSRTHSLYCPLFLSRELCLKCLHRERESVHLLHDHTGDESAKLHTVRSLASISCEAAFNHRAHHRGVVTFRQFNVVYFYNLEVKSSTKCQRLKRKSASYPGLPMIFNVSLVHNIMLKSIGRLGYEARETTISF